jgi:glycosyltransferase involved in cell wall biosynthesis
VDGDSTDNPKVIASIFNKYFFSVAENILPRDNNATNNINTGINDIKDKHSGTINSDPSHYLAQAFNNLFLNMQLKFSITKEIENIIKSLKPKNTYGYNENYLTSKSYM